MPYRRFLKDITETDKWKNTTFVKGNLWACNRFENLWYGWNKYAHTKIWRIVLYPWFYSSLRVENWINCAHFKICVKTKKNFENYAIYWQNCDLNSWNSWILMNS